MSNARKGLTALAVVLGAAFLLLVSGAVKAAECNQYGIPIGSDRAAAIAYFEQENPEWSNEGAKEGSGRVLHQYASVIQEVGIVQVVTFMFEGDQLAGTVTTYRTEARAGGELLMELFKRSEKNERVNCGSQTGAFKYMGRFPGFVAIRENDTGQMFALEREGGVLWLHVWYGDSATVIAEANKKSI